MIIPYNYNKKHMNRKIKRDIYLDTERRVIMYNTYEELVNSLCISPASSYNIEQAENLADEVLKIGGYDKEEGSTPIVKIAKKFGFEVLQVVHMENDISGNIFIGGTTKDVCGKDKLIAVRYNDNQYHQRFIIAHELGHFLMDYLGSEVSKNTHILFTQTYPKKDHDSEIEVRADRFAAEILMPKKLFSEQYLKAMDTFFNNRDKTINYLSRYFRTKESSIERRIQELVQDSMTL